MNWKYNVYRLYAIIVALIWLSVDSVYAAGADLISYGQVASFVKAVSLCLVPIGAFKVFLKFHQGEQGIEKTIFMVVGGCVALMAMIFGFRRMFGV